jgi:hypothetical protein
MSVFLGILSGLLPLTLIGAVGYALYRSARARYARAARGVIDLAAEGGKAIPIIAAFTGVRWLPWWVAVASNNAAPSLVILPSGVRYRVIKLRERPFSDIERIDVRTAWATVNIELRFHDEALTLMANVGTEKLARATLELLPKSIALTPRAKAILADGEPRDAAPSTK